MRWGFGWDLGPFELFDAIGVREVLERGRDGRARDAAGPAADAEVLDAGRQSFREGLVPPGRAGSADPPQREGTASAS
jgi:hypothetical protein